MSALKYWLWLTAKPELDGASVLRLLDHFVTPERVYYADPEEYDLVEGLPPAKRKALRDRSTDGAERILADCDRLGLRILTWQDAQYPERLRQLELPPPLLYVRGRWFHFDEEAAVGVVGAREATQYGESLAGRLGLELARGGALVVSGIAEGIDTAAVKGALRGGGPVVSVLAGGVDLPFPRENRFLYEDVAAAGALISEHPPGTKHIGHHFPIRNRIISGLSLGVVAVECRIHSGTMRTVNHALDQNRDVFSVPGNVDAPMSRGPNLLIQQGAKLVTCGEDILVEYRPLFPEKLSPPRPLGPEAEDARLEDIPQSRRKQIPDPEPEQPQRALLSLQQQKERFTDDQIALLHALGEKNRSADELVEAAQIPARRVLSALTMLQVEGVVEEGPGRRFSCLVNLEPI